MMRAPTLITKSTKSVVCLALLLPFAHVTDAQTARLPSKLSAKASKEGFTKDGFTTAASKKPGAGVTVRYRVNSTPTANTPVAVTLQFRDINSANGATARFYTADGARIDATGPIALASGVVREVTVQVTPSADGLYYLNVQTEQAGRSSVTSVPIQVGTAPPKLAKHGTLQFAPGGERVVSLPAQTQAK